MVFVDGCSSSVAQSFSSRVKEMDVVVLVRLKVSILAVV